MEKWNAHFIELLGRTKEKMILEERRTEEERIQKIDKEDKEISRS